MYLREKLESKMLVIGMMEEVWLLKIVEHDFQGDGWGGVKNMLIRGEQV